jgi:hypothetical protein
VAANGTARLGSQRRTWRADGESTWAECLGNVRHPKGVRPPAPSCSCGLYAMHPPRLQSWLHLYGSGGDFRIAGIVEAWGRVHVHTAGFRAQYARPVAVALIGFPRVSDFGRLVEDVAITHRAELLEFRYPAELAEHCARNGLGMSSATVERLLGEQDPGPLRVGG